MWSSVQFLDTDPYLSTFCHVEGIGMRWYEVITRRARATVQREPLATPDFYFSGSNAMEVATKEWACRVHGC